MKKYKLIIIFSILVLILNASFAYPKIRFWKTIKIVPGKLLKVVTHPKFVAVLDYAVSFMHVYYDASYDAVFWQINASRNKNLSIQDINDSMYGGCNIYNIHYYKNMARLALVLKGYCIGVSLIHIKDGKLCWQRLLQRELGMMPAMMTIWQLRYKYCRYNKAWDTSAAHNGTRYVIPLPTKDIKIALKGWQVSLANTVEIFTSSYFFAKDVFTGIEAERKNKIDDSQ